MYVNISLVLVGRETVSDGELVNDKNSNDHYAPLEYDTPSTDHEEENLMGKQCSQKRTVSVDSVTNVIQ